MSDFDKNKDIRRKKYYTSQRDRDNPTYSNIRRGVYKYERENRDIDRVTEMKEKYMPQPTILLKNRESNTARAISPKRATSTSKDIETQNTNPTHIQKPKQSAVDLSSSLWAPPNMDSSVQLIDSNFMFMEDAQEFLQDNSSDFLVVGILGAQGVGKSSIMNWLAQDNFRLVDLMSPNVKHMTEILSNLNVNKCNSNIPQESKTEKPKYCFREQNIHDIERGVNCTSGVNIYVASNRMIFLDTQPILSMSILDEMIQTGSTATAAGEVIPTDNSSEIQSLQLAAFIFTVCHIVIVVQDWFFDPNIVRFLQTAEMLKPSTTASGEEELNEHSPHLLLVHNRARMEDFNPPQFKIMQQVYRKVFNKSKLKIDSGMGIGTGNIMHSLCPTTAGEPLNIYLLPELYSYQEQANSYRGHPSVEELVRKLKGQIQGASRSLLTHAQLSERAWLHYACKAWDVVKKSSFFVEYNKLLPKSHSFV